MNKRKERQFDEYCVFAGALKKLQSSKKVNYIRK